MSENAQGTGRIRRTLSRSALKALENAPTHRSRASELAFLGEIDRAHLIMLVSAGLLDRSRAAAILGEIRQLERDAFAPLCEAEAPRGIYLLYEQHLIGRLGEDVAGDIHMGRSRNDLNATLLRMSLREPLAGMLRELLRLLAILLAGARRHAGTVMPVYTHYQAAQPGSYGHYLAAIAQPLQRSAGAMLDVIDRDIDICPLGAGAATGTSLPIKPDLTSSLLGFRGPAPNSLDAVASRDFALRLLSETSILGVALSRLAADLLLWSTSEFGFLSLPDSLVGSSSMMPQKRNPYLLEHIQGRAAKPLGLLVAAATAMHSKPFTNNIAAGTEAVGDLAGALSGIASAICLTRLMIMGAVPRRDAMRAGARRGFLEATEIANRLALSGVPFRTAHRRVGEEITGLESGLGQQDAPPSLGGRFPEIEQSGLDPETTMRATAYGGGPGGVAAGLARDIALLRSHVHRLAEWTRRHKAAKRRRESEASRICNAMD
jgi:argininosuccinate lyase